jgi:hypothetical protein
MTRLEKLETLVKIEEGIQSYLNRIEIAEEIIENEGSYFREIRDIYTNKKDTYERCIVRLEQRLNKQLKELNK